MKNWINNLKWKFDWMRVYFSPFKPIIPNLYIGEIAIGTPYYYPRIVTWNKNNKCWDFKDKKIGFDFVGLGWKVKWDDYRFEWNPVWSFVFFKWQIALKFIPEHDIHYWECWLYYSRDTDKTKTTRERLEQARKEFPCVWSSTVNGVEVDTDYWDLILKDKWRK